MKFAAIVAGALLVGAAGAQTWDFTHTWASGDTTMANRLFRDGVASTYGTPKAFPGTLTGPVFYQVYTITNNLGTIARLDTTTNSLDNTTINSFTSVYLGAFDPTNLATNYWGDEGSSPSTTPTSASYGPFNPGDTINIMVGSLNTGANVGFGYNVHAVLSPVPEPASMAVLGLGALALIRRRRQSK